MTSNDSSIPLKRRAGTRSINYSEKDADAEIVQRIDHLEKVKNRLKNQNRLNQRKSNKPLNGKVSGAKTTSGTAKNKYQKFLNDKNVGWNFIPSLPVALRKTSRFSNILDLKDSVVNIVDNTLRSSGSVLLKANDTIYMVSEPPGEPYYIGRVVEFVVKPEFRELIEELKHFTKEYAAKYFQVKMNWFYRARDIQENVMHFDTRLVYASLHQDVCPIISYRGKCTVLHSDELENESLDKAEILAKPNTFYFDQLFDRYSLQYYDVQGTDKLLNLDKSSPFLCALNKWFRYIFTEEKYPLEKMLEKYVIVDKSVTGIEHGHVWDNRCTVCREWCSSNQSLKCDECHSSVHLFCMEPPLDRKPNKGVIWICFNCLKRQEGTAEALEELKQEEDKQANIIKYEKIHLDKLAKAAMKQVVSKLNGNYWFQYMGEHMLCHMEDLLHCEFYIPYPFKIARTGLKYQWTGSTENEDWKPTPYSLDKVNLNRGTSATSELLWSLDDNKITETALDQYIETCKAVFPKKLEIVPESCNFLDMIAKALMTHNYCQNSALSDCESQLSRDSLREPTFTAAEIEKFEKAVAKHGSELHLVCKDVGTQSMSMIVRYYYYWKKTSNGKNIWGGFKGRNKNKGKKTEGTKVEIKVIGGKPLRERNPTKLALENRSDFSKEELKFMDDSCFDTENMALVKTCFKCVFCEIDYSPLWYKITGGSEDEHVKHRLQTGVTEKSDRMCNHESTPENESPSKNKNDRLDALCIRCARLWRRYGTKWQQPLDVFKRLFGSNIHIINTSLDRTFEDTNANVSTVQPEQARNKLLEWELVTDTEFIIRQRLNLVKHPENIPKLKASTLASRSALYKLTKKPFDSEHSNVKHSLKELQNLLATMTRKKLKTSGNTRKATEKGGKITSEKSTKQIKPSSNNLRSDDTPPALNVINYGLDLSPNGDIQIKIPCANGDFGELLVKSDFENITVNSILTKQLISTLPLKRHSSQEPGNFSDTDSHHKLSRKSNKSLSTSESSLPELEAPGVANKPKIVHENSTPALLDAYHSYETPSFNISKAPFSTDAKKLSKGSIERREFCDVCRKKFKDSLDEELVCNNCGMNVHHYCYGIKFDKLNISSRRLRDFKWLCDPCSNELNPIESTNYQCTLCSSKNRDCDSLKSQYNGPCRDALKCTTAGTWTHVGCALFNQDLKFGSSRSLQPIINSRAVILRNAGQKCALCSSEGGGLVNCDQCSKKFHVTCAQNNPSFDLLFKKTNGSSQSGSLSSSDNYNSRNQLSYPLIPVFLCDDHQKEALKNEIYLPLDATIDDTSCSLMQQYTSRHLVQSRHTMVYERYLEQKAMTDRRSGIEKIVRDEPSNKFSEARDLQLNQQKRFKDLKNLLEGLPENMWSSSAEGHVETQTRYPNSSTDYKLDTFETAKRPLSETQIDILTCGVDPGGFEIIDPTERKDKKRKKVTVKSVTNK